MTDFRARGTIMGPAGLTAVFGMGTGGTPQVSSPECPRRAVKLGKNGLARDQSGLWCHTAEAGKQILEQASGIKLSQATTRTYGSRTEPNPRWMRADCVLRGVMRCVWAFPLKSA